MNAPVVALPRQFKGVTLSKLAAGIAEQCPNGVPDRIVLDFKSLSFIRPAGVVFLSNFIYWLVEHGAQVDLVNVDAETPALQYLDDSLFFEQHCGEKVRPHSSPRSTTQPLQQIAHSDSHHWLESKLVPWLAQRLGLTPASLYDLKTCLSELFNNIKDHTTYDIGSIFVQYYPGEDRVSIALSDFGLGIPEKVRQSVPDLNDASAIIKAVQEGFTSKSTPGNAGLGLDYLLNTVVGTNDGTVTIYSLGGIVQFHQDAEGKICHRVIQNVGFCPGTTIDINLRTALIEALPQEREDLEW